MIIKNQYKILFIELLKCSRSKTHKDLSRTDKPIIYHFLQSFSPTLIRAILSNLISFNTYKKQKKDASLDKNEEIRTVEIEQGLFVTLNESESNKEIYDRKKNIFEITKNEPKQATIYHGQSKKDHLENLLKKQFINYYNEIITQNLLGKAKSKKLEKMTIIYNKFCTKFYCSEEDVKDTLGQDRCAILPIVRKKNKNIGCLQKADESNTTHTLNWENSYRFIYTRETIKNDFKNLFLKKRFELNSYTREEAFYKIWKELFNSYEIKLDFKPYSYSDLINYPSEFYIFIEISRIYILHIYGIKYYHYIKDECYNIATSLHNKL